MSEPQTPDFPVGAWDPESRSGAELDRVRLQALAELEPLKEELRERARRIAEREAELEQGKPANGTPEEDVAQRPRDLAAAELAELEPLKEELRERMRRIAEREAELEQGKAANGTPEETLAQRARDLAAAERAALEAVDARARALDLRAKDLARRARELEADGPFNDPGFVGFSEGFEAFAASRRKRRAPGR